MGNEQSASSQRSSGTKQTEVNPHGIIVVGAGQTPPPGQSFPDTYLSRLNTCPSFEPIASVTSLSADIKPKHGDLVGELDWRSAAEAASRLQDHLKACAEAISFDQNSLTSQIKQLDQQSNQVLLKFTERQRAFAKYAEHTRKIDEISSSLKKVRMRLDAAFSMLEDINNFLPEEEQIDIQ